jgi:mevalonate pyrophosphate decarboxylase
MISTAIAIQDATTSAVHDETIMDMAGHLYHARNEMTDDEFIQFLFKYSANLSALTATLVTSVCLTESQMNEMVETIKEFEALGEENN